MRTLLNNFDNKELVLAYANIFRMSNNKPLDDELDFVTLIELEISIRLGDLMMFFEWVERELKGAL